MVAHSVATLVVAAYLPPKLSPVKVSVGLRDLLLRVHHKGAALGHRLADGPPLEDEGASREMVV